MEFNITMVIIIVTCIISYQAIKDPSIKNKLAHYPYQEKRTGEWFRMVSSGFVHADYMHLGFNMFVLYGFGSAVEQYFGSLYGEYMGRITFILLYILNIVAADLPTYYKHQDNPRFSSLGASGAVAGILFIFIAIYPWAPLSLMFIPIGIPAFIMGAAYLIYSSYAAKKMKGRINHTAHLYGALFGLAFLWITKPHMIRHFIEHLLNDFSTFRFF